VKTKPKAPLSQSRAKQSSPAAPLPPDLRADEPLNWKFDEEEVSNAELVACCYWEYARESAFIRRVVQRLKDTDQRKVTRPLVTAGKPWVQTHCLRVLEEAGAKVELPALRRGEQNDYSRYYKQMLEAQAAQPESVADDADLNQLYSIGIPVVELFRRLPFPKPWQSLTPAQRRAGKDFVLGDPTPAKIPPFRTSNDYLVASELYSQARRIHDKEAAVWMRLAEIGVGMVNLEEATKLRNTLSEQAKHPTPVVSRGIGGVDFFIAQIDWAHFTNDQIADAFRKWVEPNRPKSIPKPSRQGHGPREWRARLTRLAAMRLLHSYKANEILGASHHRAQGTRKGRQGYIPPLPECGPILKAKPFCRDAWLEPETWYEARREALKDSYWLLAFLPPDQLPHSWQTKSGTT
jgi:hypothetical protein